jgi:hypothetical protein
VRQIEAAVMGGIDGWGRIRVAACGERVGSTGGEHVGQQVRVGRAWTRSGGCAGRAWTRLVGHVWLGRGSPRDGPLGLSP